MTWTELIFPAPAADHPGLLAGVIGPLLADLRERGAPGFFLRELGPDGDTRLLVQLRDAADLTGTAGSRPAEVAPLGGPVFGGPALDTTTRDFLAEVAPVALALAGHPDRLAAALDLMTAHLTAVADPARSAGGPPLSFLSFRSHAEAFIATSRDPDAARRALDTHYAATREAIEARVRAILVDGDLGPAAAWHAAVRAAKPTLIDRFRSGSVVAHTAYAQDHLRERADFAGSDFHSTAGASADLQSYLSSDPSFLATRLLTSLLYVTLHSAGVSLMERYFLCHAISRACEAVYEVDSLELLTTLAH